MSEDLLTLIGVIVASVIGTTGVSGLLAGGVEVGRRNRLRRNTERALDLRDRLKSRTPEWEALSYSARLDSVRLAALSSVGLMRGMRERLRRALLVSILWTALAVGTIWLQLQAAVPRESITFFLVLYSALILTGSGVTAWLLDGQIRRDRAVFVRRVMAGEPVTVVVEALKV